MPLVSRNARLWLATLAVLTIAGASFAAEPFAPPRSAAPDIAYMRSDAFVVVFQRETAHRLSAARDAQGRPRASHSAVQRLIERHGIQGFERQFATARPQPQGSRFPDLTGHYLVRVPEGADIGSVMAEWAAEPGVDHVEPIGIHSVDATPNDTWWIYGTGSFPYDQWHYWDSWGIDADLAWDLETGDSTAVVAILDTGVKYRHTDLGGNNPPGPADNDTQGNVWVNRAEIPANAIDDDGNGYVDDVIGWDFVSAPIPGTTCDGYDADCGVTENDPNDGEGHGTFCAGVVAAITNNARAGAGTAGGFSDGTTAGAGNGVRVLPLRIGHRARVVLPPPVVTGLVDMSWCAQAMNYVADLKQSGVNIVAVNCSWGSSNSGGISAAVDNLLANDVMVICAAGNSNSSTAPFLSTKNGVLTVGASDSTGVGASFTNYGAWVDVAAPGVGIFSITHDPADPDTTHNYVSVGDGTSFSSPMTCGVAALIESMNPTLSAVDKANLLTSTASPFNPANTKALGTGIVNAYAALQAVPPVGVGDLARPASLSLGARPNPTRSGAELTFATRAGSRVRLAIVDVHGRTVRSLGVTDAGRVRWDGADDDGRPVAPGLYFAVAQTATDRAVRRLVLLR